MLRAVVPGRVHARWAGYARATATPWSRCPPAARLPPLLAEPMRTQPRGNRKGRPATAGSPWHARVWCSPRSSTPSTASAGLPLLRSGDGGAGDGGDGISLVAMERAAVRRLGPRAWRLCCPRAPAALQMPASGVGRPRRGARRKRARRRRRRSAADMDWSLFVTVDAACGARGGTRCDGPLKRTPHVSLDSEILLARLKPSVAKQLVTVRRLCSCSARRKASVLSRVRGRGGGGGGGGGGEQLE